MPSGAELITSHAIPRVGRRRLARLAPEDLERLYAEKLDAGLSAQTVTNLHRVLHSAFEQAVRRNQMARNVCDLVDPPRVKKYEIKPLDVEQARRFLSASRAEPNGALYIVAITTGMRLGELLALKWADVDLGTARLQVRRGVRRIPRKGFVEREPKSTQSRRRIHLAPPTLEALRLHRAAQLERRLKADPLWEDSDLVFPNEVGRYIEPGNLKRRSYWPLLDRAGLPRVRFHDLRHSAASLLLALGGWVTGPPAYNGLWSRARRNYSRL